MMIVVSPGAQIRIDDRLVVTVLRVRDDEVLFRLDETGEQAPPGDSGDRIDWVPERPSRRRWPVSRF
jgi:hypothetical protein